MKRVHIAIDGPAGAGKSTMAKIIAKELDITYLDTGAMYRTAGLKAINEGIDTSDKEKIIDMIKNINMDIIYKDKAQHIYLDQKDVSELIRTGEVSKAASDVAVIPEVRIKMVELQREIASDKSVVMDGRDIGTYVLKEADFKFYLTASVKQRAERRYIEMREKGEKNISIADIEKEIEYRDKNDSTRSFAPLKKADDAVLIDTSCLSIKQVSEKMLEIIKEKYN